MDDARIVDHLTRLCRALDREDGTSTVLSRLVDLSGEITGTEAAGVTLLGRGGASTPVCSGELVIRVDSVQYETGQGPCLDAAAGHPVVRCDDLGSERRWPSFAPRAVDMGVRSMLSFQISVTAGPVGSLNLYARTPSAFDTTAEQIGRLVSPFAALAVAAARRRQTLRSAMDSRAVVGRAMGMLMERHKIDSRHALEMLREVSRTNNIGLVEVAEQLTTSGKLGP